jgi:hypothetical protein
MNIIVERVLAPTPAVTQIVGELDAVWGAPYGAEQR